MKTKLSINKLVCCATLLVLALASLDTNSSIARAQGTAFTYQGRLDSSGSPANGNYDLKFTLFGVSGGGSSIAGPVTNTAVAVTNGLFTTMLDLGANFPGADRWMEIGVRTNGAVAFATLSPRQKISSTPYAIQSANAASAISVSGPVDASQLMGTISGDNIGPSTITSLMLADGSIHSNHLAVGSVHSNALVFGSIHSNHLAVGSVHSNALALGSVTDVALAAGSVHSNHLGIGSVHSNALAFASIHSNHLAVGSVHSNALALGSVTPFALADGSIHSNHLAVGSVHSNALVFGSIHSNHLAVGSVHSNALALGSVTAFALADGSIHSNHLAVGSIHSNALALGSVTALALADGSIHSNNLAVGAVSPDKLIASLSGSFSISITNPSIGFFEYFGIAVAAVGTDKVLVGAYQDSTGADNAGAAYLLSTSGTLMRTFLSPAPQNQEHFGFAVASMGQDKVLIGADGNSVGGLNSGAAYLFGINGTVITTFTNPTPAASDSFGYSVAAVGTDKVLIGAYGDHFGANLGGAAYLFTTNRTLLTTFTNPTPASGDRFGIAVAAVGADQVLIGADGDDGGASDAGVAYLFHISGALLATFTNPTPAMSDAFGAAVAAVDWDKVLIGTPGDNSTGNAGGAAYLFSTSGTLLTTLTNPTPASGDQFGAAVAAVDANNMLIGAPSDDSGAPDAGAAYLFGTEGTLLWTSQNPAPANGNHFGNAITAVGTDRVLVGAPQEDLGATDSGAAHLFALEPFTPGLVADLVRPGSITATSLDPAIGVWTRAGSNIFRAAGNVGIGTSTPAFPLDVAGPVRISSMGNGAEALNLDIERSWAFRQLGSGAGTALELASVGGGGNKNFVINTTGLVGIGTTAPLAQLHIVGGGNAHLRLHDSGAGNYWTIYTENHPTLADGNLLFVPGPTGTFGFIQKSTGNYFSGSDARLKQDIRNLDGVLDRVLQLRPVTYRFKSAPKSAPRTIGLIAQDVEPLFPEAVGEHDGMKSLAYSELIPVAVGAIQELNQKVEERANRLEQEVKRRDAENEELRQTVNELKEIVETMNRKLEGGGKITPAAP